MAFSARSSTWGENCPMNTMSKVNTRAIASSPMVEGNFRKRTLMYPKSAATTVSSVTISNISMERYLEG